MLIVDVDNVSIRYRTGNFKNIGLKEYIMHRFRGTYQVEEFWANKNITFSLKQGDMLGIIGVNGAGKSTILKAIAGILAPSEGKVTVQGNIAALLELGTGFDGDLTVRENTYLRGALLGYTREFMNKKYSEIIDFAELQEFQEYPFKQLSSGMKSRLAFSIACLVNPDIIILDEVLSVGDGAFREKSREKMREILSGGVTGILVSHSTAQIAEMCNKVLWLNRGWQIGFSEDVSLYCDAYNEYLKTKIIPETAADITRLAAAWRYRLELKRKREIAAEQKKKKEMQDLLVKNRGLLAKADTMTEQKGKLLERNTRLKEKVKWLHDRAANLHEQREKLREINKELKEQNKKLRDRAVDLHEQRGKLREINKELKEQNKQLCDGTVALHEQRE